jgi:hypothetical protein
MCLKTKELAAKNCREMFPGRSKEWGSHCENSIKEQCSQETNKNVVLP